MKIIALIVIFVATLLNGAAGRLQQAANVLEEVASPKKIVVEKKIEEPEKTNQGDQGNKRENNQTKEDTEIKGQIEIKGKEKMNNQFSTDLKYPGATVVSESSSEISMLSTDNPQVITDWYKAKISVLGMNAKSFITTSTNSNVLNKLVGSNGTREVSVTVSRAAGESQTTIAVRD